MKPDESLALLRSALLSVGDLNKLNSVRHHYTEIQAALDDSDLELDEKSWSTLQERPDWLAAVYESLSGGQADTESSSDVSRAIDELRRDEQREIGEAFAALLSELPRRLRLSPSEQHVFAGVKPVDQEYQHELRERPSVRAAGDIAYEFVRYGLTPESIYDATRGLFLLFNRLRQAVPPRALFIQAATSSMFLQGADTKKWFPISQPLLIAEVAGTPDLSPGVESPLSEWLMEVVRLRPLLVEGYEARDEDEKLYFEPALPNTATTWRTDLIARWSR